MIVTFTPNQLRAWKAYERVRKSGRYNMFDPRARRDSGLGAEMYSFVMQHFSELRAAIEAEKRT